ncbi:unnamed protein product [Soboliphyme baturini]|uniref:Dehydrogenase/reductase SDR family protein 7-like n=1 Tax=Soboliphyme baturini TaxID=241478 RepID=A0A183ILK5_9BILA|nr:unnamed protein product [Soboliphyme baturini]
MATVTVSCALHSIGDRHVCNFRYQLVFAAIDFMLSLGVLTFVLCAWMSYTTLAVVLRRRARRRGRQALRGKTVLITGASSGLGMALACRFYGLGCKVLLAARNVDKLQKLRDELMSATAVSTDDHSKSPEPLCYYLDLSRPDSVLDTCRKILAENENVDVVVNNAGVSVRANCLDTTLDVHRYMMEVNYFGHVALTQAMTEHMVGRRPSSDSRDIRGRFICIGSVQGLFSIPHRSAYAASKHAFQAYFDCFRAEMTTDNIHVLFVSPGYIKTNLSANALTGDGGKYNKVDSGEEHGADPDVVASRVIDAFLDDKEELIVAPAIAKVAMYMRYLLPHYFFKVMARRALKEEKKTT